MRAAIYLRVSTDDGRQTVEIQQRELSEYAHRQGWRVVATFSEQISGAANIEDRPQLAQAFAAAARREFDVLIVFSLSRLTRGGPFEALTLVRRLRDSGVELISISEEFLRSIGPMREAIIGLLAWLHEEERRHQLAGAGVAVDDAVVFAVDAAVDGMGQAIAAAVAFEKGR